MPELPEVETVRRGLNRLVKGRTITKGESYYDKIINGSVAGFKHQLVWAQILANSTPPN